MKQVFRLFWLMFSLGVYSQVQVSVDTTNIRIGEQITYTIDADADSSVEFPDLKLKSSDKITLVKSLPVDSIKNRLAKKYLLTSFDSGTHTIPAQEIKINGVAHYLDSISIQVKSVAVDTTKQALYPIKSINKAPPKQWQDYLSGLWWLILLGAAIALVWWFLKRKKTEKETSLEKNYTPYEWAQLQLKTLDNSKFLIQGKIKQYYSDLTTIVRHYLERDFDIPALEYTTDELILKLKVADELHKFGLDQVPLDQLELFLQSADLVKFAKAKPIDINIKEDRKFAEGFIDQLHRLIEDKRAKEAEQALKDPDNVLVRQQQRETRQKRLIGLGVVTGILILAAIWSYFGTQNIKETVLGTSTKSLLNKDWFSAAYGYPSVSVYAPFVLKTSAPDWPEYISQQATSQAHFTYGKPGSSFYMTLSTLELKPPKTLKPTDALNNALELLKQKPDIKNIDYETSETSISSFSGQLADGTYQLNKQKYRFQIHLIAVKNSLVAIKTVYRASDKNGAQLNDRIIQAIKIERDNL